MSFKVNMDGVKAKVRRICQNRQLGAFLASEAASGMDKYVPYRTGALSQSVSTQPFRVHYGMKYARRMFYGEDFNFSTEHHALAQAKWSEAYANAFGEELGNAGTRFLRMLR